MKKLFLLLFIFFIFMTNPVMPQGVLNRVRNAVTKEIVGNKGNDSGSANKSSETAPEPDCACDTATTIMDLGGEFKIDYNEISLSMKDDGSILVHDRIGSKYYISKDGRTEGPYGKDDPRVSGFHSTEDGDYDQAGPDYWYKKYPDYILRSGDNYLIKVKGKSYGPFAQINDFAIPKSKDKFAAIVTEKVYVMDDETKKMEAAMKNAKTDQEKMELSMKYSQQIAQRMTQSEPEAFTPKMVSDVPGAVYDMVKWAGGRLNGTARYDEIVVATMDKVLDLKGNTLTSLKPGFNGQGQFFLSSSNNRYTNYKYGTLTFNDNKIMSSLFNPFLARKGGKVSLNYMYYSPGKNAILQCSIPF